MFVLRGCCSMISFWTVKEELEYPGHGEVSGAGGYIWLL